MELIAVLENPIYVINIGHVIRNIVGLGIDKLYIVDAHKRLESDGDLLKKRKTLIKHSSGAVQHAHITRFDSTEACMQHLSVNGFTSVGTSPESSQKRSYLLHKSDLTAPKLAIWFGDEANGLTTTALNECDYCLTIEMSGNVESFNLATTTGIVLYEALRQRK